MDWEETRTEIDGCGRPLRTFVNVENAETGRYESKLIQRSTDFDAEQPQRVRHERLLEFEGDDWMVIEHHLRWIRDVSALAWSSGPSSAAQTASTRSVMTAKAGWRPSRALPIAGQRDDGRLQVRVQQPRRRRAASSGPTVAPSSGPVTGFEPRGPRKRGHRTGVGEDDHTRRLRSARPGR